MLAVLSFAACDDDDGFGEPAFATITENVEADDRFSVLASALQRTGLDEVFDRTGDFTFFAPTNDAFAASGIDLATVSDEDLLDLLSYHILGVSITSGELIEGDTYVSTFGTFGPDDSQLTMLINRDEATVKVNEDAMVVVANITASNGIIHGVDEVLAPQTVADFIVKSIGISELDSVLVAGNLLDDLSGTELLTLFAPVNSAFEAISSTVDSLTNEQLVRVLTYHITNGNVRSEDFTISMLPSLNATNMIDLGEDAGTFFIRNGGARTDFVFNDVQGTNGVIHFINVVLIPADL